MSLPKLVTALALVATLAGCKEPEPVGLIAFLYCSASFELHHGDALQAVRSLNDKLLGQIDWVLAFRLSSEVNWLRDAEKAGSKRLIEALDQNTQVDKEERGTAYGTALTRAVREARTLSPKVARTAVVLLGDGEDERSTRGGNIDWATLPAQYADFPAEAHLFLLYVTPKAGDRLREALKPILKDRLHLFVPADSGAAATSTIRNYLQR